MDISIVRCDDLKIGDQIFAVHEDAEGGAIHGLFEGFDSYDGVRFAAVSRAETDVTERLRTGLFGEVVVVNRKCPWEGHGTLADEYVDCPVCASPPGSTILKFKFDAERRGFKFGRLLDQSWDSLMVKEFYTGRDYVIKNTDVVEWVSGPDVEVKR